MHVRSYDLEFPVDIARHTDGRPIELPKLDNKTRSNASNSAIFRYDTTLRIQYRVVSNVGKDWHPKTVTKAHDKRLFGRNDIYFRCSTPIQHFCMIIDLV